MMSEKSRGEGGPAKISKFWDIGEPWAAGAIFTRGLAYLLNPRYYSRPLKHPIIELPGSKSSSENDGEAAEVGGVFLIGVGTLMATELRKNLTRRRLFIRATSAMAGVLTSIFHDATEERE